MPEQLFSDPRRYAPATERNRAPILDVLAGVLAPIARSGGTVLEIASGTGEHAIYFASRLSGLVWQPSDPDAEARASIAARTRLAGSPNVPAPLALDVTEAEWPIDRADAIVAINMVHISPWAATTGLFAGAARRLPAGAPLVLYGPYRRNGAHTAPSNAAFDRNLRLQNPAWGVRDLEAVTEVAETAGFRPDAEIEMPANNLCLVFRRV